MVVQTVLARPPIIHIPLDQAHSRVCISDNHHETQSPEKIMSWLVDAHCYAKTEHKRSAYPSIDLEEKLVPGLSESTLQSKLDLAPE